MTTKSSRLITHFLEEQNWVDVWRAHNEEIFQFTWKGGKPLKMSRLDYFLAPLGTLTAVKDIEIQPMCISDHSPIILNLSIEFTMRGPGYWKLNNKHLGNKNFVEEINEAIDILLANHKMYNPINKWVKINNDLKEAAIRLLHRNATERKKQKEFLNKKLKTLHKKLSMINLSSAKAIDLNCHSRTMCNVSRALCSMVKECCCG